MYFKKEVESLDQDRRVSFPYSLSECVQNYYSEPILWDIMIRINRRSDGRK